MKKKYEKPSFVPIVLNANVLADCKYTNNYSWEVCPIVIDNDIKIFSDENVCTYGPDMGISICDHIPQPNANTFGS